MATCLGNYVDSAAGSSGFEFRALFQTVAQPSRVQTLDLINFAEIS